MVAERAEGVGHGLHPPVEEDDRLGDQEVVGDVLQLDVPLDIPLSAEVDEAVHEVVQPHVALDPVRGVVEVGGCLGVKKSGTVMYCPPPHDDFPEYVPQAVEGPRPERPLHPGEVVGGVGRGGGQPPPGREVREDGDAVAVEGAAGGGRVRGGLGRVHPEGAAGDGAQADGCGISTQPMSLVMGCQSRC